MDHQRHLPLVGAAAQPERRLLGEGGTHNPFDLESLKWMWHDVALLCIGMNT